MEILSYLNKINIKFEFCQNANKIKLKKLLGWSTTYTGEI